MVTHPTNLERERSIPEIYAEGLHYFMGEGTLNKTLARLANDLDERGIDYIVIGAVALLAYGYPRFTEDIDLVMTKEGLAKFHEELVGLGYAPSFPGARKRLRSTTDGVSIEVMTTGEYPGDGKPKPVSMPEPIEASVKIDGINFVSLEKLIELKLASGISAAHRLKDLADVQELIKIRKLDADFAGKLDPYVRKKYLELEAAVRESGESESIQEK
jgi:predicted nucleotidyltransferase